MTAADRRTQVRAWLAACQRAARAESFCDHAGHLIAEGDARRLLRLILNADRARAAQAAR